MTIVLKLLNSPSELEIPYLPHGAITIAVELSNTGKESRRLILRPGNRSSPPDYVAYESSKDGKTTLSKDLKIIWGGGMTNGFELTLLPNKKTNLFYLIMHDSEDLAEYSFELELVETTDNGDEKMIDRSTVKLKPTRGYNNSYMRLVTSFDGVNSRIAEFKGDHIPDYKSRWFGKRDYSFRRAKVPCIVLRYGADSGEYVTSDIRIGIRTAEGIKDIGKIGGDLHRAKLSAEIFDFTTRYCVLRIWLYWINTFFSDNRWIGGTTGCGSRQSTELRWWRQRVIEAPDVERFDVVIDKEAIRIVYVGTDLHWRETWWSVDNDFANLKFAELELVPVLIRELPQLLRPYITKYFGGKIPSGYDPANALRKDLEKGDKPKGDPLQTIRQQTRMVNASGDTMLGHGLHRKHVPFIMDFSLMPRYVSDVLTDL
jgi:hypothetical protein